MRGASRGSVVLGLVLSASASAIAAPGRYAVVIGNNEGARFEQPLQYAERDASELAKVLVRHGEVPAQNSVLLLGEDPAAIRRAILDINVRIRNAPVVHEDSTLFVYYSGHAGADGLHIGGQSLSYEELRAMIASSAAKARVLVLDACRSGGLTAVKGGKPQAGFPIAQLAKESVEGFAYISSSAAGEDSHESMRLGASFFTHHLLTGLRGAADRNGDLAVSLGEVYQYAYNNTLRSSKQTAQLQHPTFSYALKGRRDLEVTRLGGLKNASGRLILGAAGLYLISREARSDAIVAEVVSERPGTQLMLTPGRYVVQERRKTRYLEYAIQLKADTQVRLQNSPRREIAYARLVRKGEASQQRAHSLFISGGVQSSILPGFGPSGSLSLQYMLDLPWFSIGLGLRLNQSAELNLGTSLSAQHRQLAPGLDVYRFFDWRALSIGLGLRVEWVVHQQLLERERRTSFGASLGPVLAFLYPLWRGLHLRLEGRAMTQILKRAKIETGAEGGSELVTPLAGAGSLGLGWTF